MTEAAGDPVKKQLVSSMCSSEEMRQESQSSYPLWKLSRVGKASEKVSWTPEVICCSPYGILALTFLLFLR